MMIEARWRKVLRDVGEAPFRTAIAVVAMIAGVASVGTILTAYSILSRELATTYDGTHPASAILTTRAASDDVVTAVRNMPDVLDAELRRVSGGRVRVGADEWKPLMLFAVRDIRSPRIDTFRLDAGAWPSAADDVMLERSALQVAHASIGDRIRVRTTDGSERSLRVSGSVHAAGLAPAWMDHVVPVFADWSSIARGPQTAGDIRIIVRGNRLDKTHIREVAQSVADALARTGHPVTQIEIPPPGRHPHADQMETFLFLLGAFAALTLLLSAALVATMTHALLAREVRQIGVMKAIGASTRQIAMLYLGQVALLAMLALAIGMPLAQRGGAGYARFSASILNATIASDSVPMSVLLAEVAAGLLVPLLVALVPIRRASRVTIHEALSDGLARRQFGSSRFDRWLVRIRWLPRPLILSLRSSFHRPWRLALTVVMLAAGGAGFISALNVAAAWTRTLDADARAHRYDIEVRFAKAIPIDRIAATLAPLADVTHAEYWPDGIASLPAAAHNPNRGDVIHSVDEQTVRLAGVPPASQLLDFPLRAGRWLAAGDGDVAVINPAVLARMPSAHVGGMLTLLVDGRPVSWRVVGIVNEVIPIPTIYAPSDRVFAATQQQPGMTRSARILTRGHDSAGERAAARSLERAFAAAGIVVREVRPLGDLRQALADHLVIIDSALLFAAALVVFAGGLGLASTLMLSVIERTRELGILGAIGAAPAVVARQIVAEGLFVGVLSWLVAIIAAVPITFVLDSVAGHIFIRTPLAFFMSPRAVVLWLTLVIVLAALSSFLPARRATRISIREALAHE